MARVEAGVENAVRMRGPLTAVTRAVLVAALIGAALITAGAVVTGVVGVVGDLAAGTLSTSLAVDSPVRASAGPLLSADYTAADVVVRSPGTVATVLYIAGAVGGPLARAALGVALIALLIAVLRRAPFSGSVALTVTLAGGIGMIAALLQAGAGALDAMMMADRLTGAGVGTWPIAAIVDPTLIGVGFGVMVVGLLLSHGEQLQRATEGLV